MFRLTSIILVIAMLAGLFILGGRTHTAVHVGLYTVIITVILVCGAILLRRRAEHRRKP